MKLFLIRHGQTEANLKKYYAGQSDIPLTELGRKQAERIRPILSRFTFDRVFSSDLSRAIDTQRIALPGIEGERTALLREYDVGSLVGRTHAEIVELLGIQIRKTRNYEEFGGESSETVCRRLQVFLDELVKDPCGYAAVFTHNGIMNCMMQIVLGADFDRTATQSPNCAIHVYEHDGTKWKLRAWNYMGEI